MIYEGGDLARKYFDDVANLIRGDADDVKHVFTVDNLEFSAKFDNANYINQVAELGWTNEMIVDTINNPIKTSSSYNKYTGNTVTNYYIDDNHYVAVDDVTHKVIQIADLGKIDWKADDYIK